MQPVLEWVMRKNPQLEAVLAELVAAGIVPRISNGGKHVRVYWNDSGGREHQCTISGTPSDRRRGAANVRAIVRRMLRRDGVNQ